jgi:UDP-N-acetyl-2-amino-2-deoxyglucuronate dehydrogenase
MNRLNLAIVGCGDIAGYTAFASRLVRQVRLAACCDVNADRARTFAGRHHIAQIFTDYAEVLAQAPVDAVYLAVPHHLHYEMIVAALEAGKAVFVEKPVTRTLAEGRKLIELAANRKVGVNYQYRYDSGCYPLARAIQSGTLGRIHSIRINVPWHRTQSYFDQAAWHKTIAQAGGGTLITQGSHFLDVALWALGEAPVSAMGYTATPGFDVEVDTLAHGLVETSGGTLINIAATMAAASEHAVRIEVYGERGTGIYSNRPWSSVKFIGCKVQRERPPEWGLHALQRSLAGFAKWALHDKPFLVPAASTLPVLAAVDGIYRSAKSGVRETTNV